MNTSLRFVLPVLAAGAGIALAMSGPAAVAGAARTASARTASTVQAAGSGHKASLRPALGPSTAGRFTAAAATSADDVWAVGLTSGPPLIWHWNGAAWVDYPFSPDLYFNGVSAVSPTDAWAVGGTYWFYPTDTVAYHWNGTSWNQVPTPTPGGSALFNGVAATSADNAWAVGSIGGGPGSPEYTVPLIEHWNGKKWTQQFFRLPVNSGQFTAVAATSADNAWAVGWTGSQAPNGALIEHWNGKKWKRLPANTPGGYGVLQGVAATSPDNAWAIGHTNTTATSQSLTLHWNGKRWSVVPSPNPTGDTNLLAVGATSAGNAWAVGYTNPSSCNPMCGTIAIHWNGKAWSVVPTPDPPADFLDAFLGVVAISPDDAWAVGTTDWGSTIIAHWNGHTWG
jgi:hypothetical protein